VTTTPISPAVPSNTVNPPASSQMKITWKNSAPTYHVTITGNHVAHSDDSVVLIPTGPGDDHVIIVSPPYGRDIVVTTTAARPYAFPYVYQILADFKI